MITYQDYETAADKHALLLEVVRQYKASEAFLRGLTANAYFRGHNTAVAGKTILKARKLETVDEHGFRKRQAITEDVVGSRIPHGYLYRFVCQQNQHLLRNGITLQKGVKEHLGTAFDHQLLALGENAILHGVCWGFWDMNHLEVLPAVRDWLSGFTALTDEATGKPRLGIQFWQQAVERPLYLRLFTLEGVTLLRQEKGSTLTTLEPLRPYCLHRGVDLAGNPVSEAGGWDALPVIPLYANGAHESEFTPAIKEKIDAADRILSDFADNLDRANDVYWVLNNFGGTSQDIADMLEEINRLKAVCTFSDGSGTSATAEPRTIEVPYAARQAALSVLDKALHRDWMALDMNAIAGGSLTNVAIRAACADLDLKCDMFEWQVCEFVEQLLSLLHLQSDTIRFSRQTIANDRETIEGIYLMRQDIDRRTALSLNPLLQPEEVERLLQQTPHNPNDP